MSEKFSIFLMPNATYFKREKNKREKNKKEKNFLLHRNFSFFSNFRLQDPPKEKMTRKK